MLLSGLQALISNAIYGGERSLKRTSTASRLIFVHSLLLLHHLSTPPSPSPSSTTPVQLADEPLPSIEGCGLDFHQLGFLTSEDTAPAAPPLSKGMWARRRGKGGAERRWGERGKEGKMRWWENEEWETQRCVTKRTIQRFVSPFFYSLT